MNIDSTLTWLAEVSRDAVIQARNGDTTLAEALGNNPSTQYYLNNVYATQAISPQQFVRQYPQLIKEADRLREASERDDAIDESVEKTSAIEAELASLREELAEEVKALKQELATVKGQNTKLKNKLQEQEEAAQDETPVDDNADDAPDTDNDASEESED